MAPKPASRKPASRANAAPPPPNPLVAPLPLTAPWTPVFDSTGTLIPFLQQTTGANVTVRKNAQATTTTKTVRFLLVTHSDGGRLIHDHAGYTGEQYCLPDDPRYLGLMCQLGESLATNLGIAGGSSGNKVAANDNGAWDVLVQLPLKYNAYYKSRAGGGGGQEHLDLYIAGHDGGKFDSVKQFAVHLAWLAGGAGGGGGCECKVCGEERKRGVRTAEQVGRKSRWAEHQGPLMQGVPAWV